MTRTAAEIQARIREADEQRIGVRTAAAQKVAALAGEHDSLQRAAAGKRLELLAAVGEALDVFTAQDLATFTGLAAKQITEWQTEGTARPRSRSSSPRRARGSSSTSSTSSTSTTEPDPSMSSGTATPGPPDGAPGGADHDATTATAPR